MTRPRTTASALLLGAAAALLVSAPLEAAAQRAPSADPDFLFRSPALTLTLRTGLFSHRAQGTFFDVTTRDYTAERSDFRSFDFGMEVAIAMGSPRLDLTVALDGGSTEVGHESRFWEETDGSPIFQSTRIRRGPAAQLGLRGYLLPRGEQISTFAWVPNTFAPYVGAGVGYTGYAVRQWGDFVYEDAEGVWIQADDLNADGGTSLVYASAGTDIALRRNLALTLEGRYQWAEDQLRQDFRFSEPLDLSGLRLTAGLSVRF